MKVDPFTVTINVVNMGTLDQDKFIVNLKTLFTASTFKADPELQQSIPNGRWLEWFLRNHDPAILVSLGLWKKSKYIVEDYGASDVVNALRAAYDLDGSDGVWPLLTSILAAELPEGHEPPELPEGWDDRIRYYRERYQGPEWSNLGKFGKDR